MNSFLGLVVAALFFIALGFGGLVLLSPIMEKMSDNETRIARSNADVESARASAKRARAQADAEIAASKAAADVAASTAGVATIALTSQTVLVALVVLALVAMMVFLLMVVFKKEISSYVVYRILNDNQANLPPLQSGQYSMHLLQEPEQVDWEGKSFSLARDLHS